MSGTGSETESFSYSDVRKVAERFAADLAMVAQATELMPSSKVNDLVSDIKAFAREGYLSEVNLFLFDATGREIRGRRYSVSIDADLWSSERPGANNWPSIPGGELSVVISYSDSWDALSPLKKENFKAARIIPWSPSSLDTSHPDLAARTTRRYASRGYGMERKDFE